MDERDGSELWFGGMDWSDGLEGWNGGMDWRDGLEGWKNGLEGWTDKRTEGCCVVILTLFSRKAKFSYFGRKSILVKNLFLWAIFAKSEIDFRSYFCENLFSFQPNFTLSRRTAQLIINSPILFNFN
jgi:hypothetical protein